MSLRIGVVYCAYQTADLIPSSLSPWVAAKQSNLGGHTYTICAISVPFEGFGHDGAEPDATRSLLGEASHSGAIDHAIVRDRPIRETEARGAALCWLVEQGCDLIWQWDADEVPTEQDILRIATYVESQPYVPAFRLCYRNLVFDAQHYLAEPFTPMRIHRVHIPGGYRVAGFWDDNNAYWQRPWLAAQVGGAVVRDDEVASMTVPALVAAPLHYTWLDDGPQGRSRRKITYQVARGWPQCSFRWDEATNSLAFNEAYYAARGEPLPTVLELDSPSPSQLP